MMGSVPRDRRVILLLAAVVGVILALNVASAIVPGSGTTSKSGE